MFALARHLPGRLFAALLGLVAALLVALAPAPALGREVPPLRAHVADEADLLSPAQEQALERKLAAYQQKTQQQFALLTIESLEGDALEDFSIRVVEAWKLGKKGKDDGLLLLVVERERKLRIEVGYGLEGDVTDAFSARVIRNVLAPALRTGDVSGGIDRSFDALMQKASGQTVGALGEEPQSSRDEQAGKRQGVSVFVLLLFVLPFLLPLFIRGGRGRRGRGADMLLGGLAGYAAGGGFGRSGGGWGGSSGGGFGGGFSGGGGGFGGGGASGSW